jgi:hypothetical protein
MSQQNLNSGSCCRPKKLQAGQGPADHYAAVTANGAGLLPGAGGGSSSMVVVAVDVVTVAVVEVAVVQMLPAINEMKCTNDQRFWPNGQRFWGSDASEGVPK